MTSAVIKWEEPPRIAAGSTITHYVLRYSAWNENGTEAFSGTEGELIIIDDTEVQIDQLSEGATYDFTVKVVYNELVCLSIQVIYQRLLLLRVKVISPWD